MGWIADRLGVRGPEHRIRVREGLSIPMRDGVRLNGRRVAPADDGRRPTLLMRTPYGIGAALPMPIMPVLAGFFARRGYNVVLQDTRGRYGSEGEFYPFTAEVDDGRDTVEWISKQPWFDGQIGMWGASYFGYTQWAIAADPPPYLKAIVPVITSTDFYGFFYPGGAFSLISALRWASGNRARRQGLAPERRLLAGARSRPLRDATAFVGRRAGFFEDWADHPERDDYWAGIDVLGARTQPVPSLLVAGTYDIFCGPQLADFAAAGASASLDLGPMAHGSYAISRRRLGWKHAGAPQMLAPSLAFLDDHLQGRPRESGRVRRYVLGEDRWVDELDWPPPAARSLRLYLRAGGRLEREAPGGDEAPDRYTYDPEHPVPTHGGAFLGPKCGPADQRPLEGRADVLRYDTAPLTESLALAGPVTLRLRVSSDAPATDFTGKLVHLPANDARPALNLCEGVARLARAPAAAGPVTVDLWHVSAVIPRGDRLRLEVSSSNFPRYDAHPNVTGNPAHATRSRPARQTVHHARDAESWLELQALGE